jgi:hypothetical protein
MTPREVASGEDLIAALVAQPHAWITAVGEVEQVSLGVAGAGEAGPRKLTARWTLASLMGPGSGPFWVVLSRSADTGVQVVAGVLERATSCGVHVFVSGGATDFPADPGSGQAARRAEKAAEPPASPSTPGPAWAAQAHAATPLRPAESDDEDVWPDAGDLVEHFAFGLCDVLMASDDRLKIRDKNGPGRVREIRAEVLRVHPPVAKDGKRLFKLERKN